MPVDKPGERPALLPGDFVLTPQGNIGVVVASCTAVNGVDKLWHQFPLSEDGVSARPGPDEVCMPRYAIEFRGSTGEKYGWWHLHELESVLSYGLFHEAGK